MRRAAMLALLLLLAIHANAAEPLTYRAAVHSIHFDGRGAWLDRVSEPGVVRTEYLTKWDAAIAAAPGRAIRVATPSFGNYVLHDFRGDAPPLLFANGAPAGSVQAMVVAATGRTYVFTSGGPGAGRALWVHEADGRLFDHDRGEEMRDAYALDLAADQCTLYALERGRLSRYDVCRGRYRDDFLPAAPEDAAQHRILPDGGVLLTASRKLLRYAADGTLVRTYEPGLGLLGALTLADGGRVAWAGVVADDGTYRVAEIDLASGGVLALIDVPRFVAGIVPYHVWTAAFGDGVARRRALGGSR
ncbi:MAG TPA: hypothetical protein VHK90_16500 [Thermoanaerobaculia bacterium]|nr:hypothetical protein [Thermoanaerobaculia bacterium]